METYDVSTDEGGKPVMVPCIMGNWYRAEDVDSVLDDLRRENDELRAAAGDTSTRWVN